MNILKRELKFGLKPFLFWSIGLFFLVFIGLTKGTGFTSGSEDIAKLLDAFPKVVLAMMGMTNINIGTFGGYYSVLTLFSAILTAVYAVWLGNSAVSKESIDKTYEFVFTKPRSRSFILAQKLLSGFIYLTVYNILNYIFSAGATSALKLDKSLTVSFLPFVAGIWFIGLIFFSLAVLFAAAVKNAERGARYGNTVILVTYIIGVVYDMLENGGAVRFFTPFKYFLPADLAVGRVDILYICLCIIISAASLLIAFRCFEKRDLNAV